MKLLLSLAGLSLLLGIILWFFVSSPTVKTVYIYEDRFEPAEIEIAVGETVHFKNMTARQVWPASNEHPSHGVYAAFDPKEPIEEGDEWEFTFDKAGIWEFHDHLRSSLKGTVVVIGEFGEAALGCVETKTGVVRATCWENDFKLLIEEQGFEVAFGEFISFYEKDASFRSYCHDIMHYVGRAAYDVYQLDNTIIDRDELSYCGYGFYHGFIEASLESDGAGGLDTAKSYCQEIFERDENADEPRLSWKAGACWHGVGHAVFDSLDGSLWGNPTRMTNAALAVCEDVFADSHMRLQCATGVFNSLANAMTSFVYGLSYESFQIDGICSVQKQEYIDACYLDAIVGYVNSNNLPLSEGINYTLSFSNIATSSISHALFGVVDDTFRRHPTADPDLVLFIQECEKFSVLAYQLSCMRGLVNGVVLSSVDTVVVDRLMRLCPLVPEGPLADYCFTRAVNIVRVTTEPSIYENFCKNNEVLKYCRW